MTCTPYPSPTRPIRATVTARKWTISRCPPSNLPSFHLRLHSHHCRQAITSIPMKMSRLTSGRPIRSRSYTSKSKRKSTRTRKHQHRRVSTTPSIRILAHLCRAVIQPIPSHRTVIQWLLKLNLPTPIIGNRRSSHLNAVLTRSMTISYVDETCSYLAWKLYFCYTTSCFSSFSSYALFVLGISKILIFVFLPFSLFSCSVS